MATVTLGKQGGFVSGETVTPTKLNQLGEPTVTLDNGEVTAAKLATTLNLTGKTITYPAGSVVTAALADGAVTEVKVATGTFATVSAGINAQTQDYTLVLGDNGKLITVNNVINRTVSIPPNASVAFPIGAQVLFARLGTGLVTIAPVGAVIIRSVGSRTKISQIYGAAALLKIGTDEWLLAGDLSA
jgi:hypothetical protein